ncbi:MAG: hypothetical protein ACRD3W_19335, partial [Terriglobales bacterium]
MFEFFAFYKNFSLLACFAGLGLGYALSNRRQVPLIGTVLLLAWQFLLLIGLRRGMPWWTLHSLSATPMTEQLNMGLRVATSASNYIAIYYFLALVFLLTALTFIPLGQLAGRCMDRLGDPLRAYGGNLIGSLIGVLLLIGLSFFWTPPLVWFAVALASLVLFVAHRTKTLVAFALASLVCLATLGWPVRFLHEVIYSPYQILERGPGDFGLTRVIAAGQYYQNVLNLSPAWQKAYPETAYAARHYDMAYTFYPHPPSVAIVGAGTGNDVAAALRANAGHVDAIEIDPAIIRIGRAYHPELPYEDKRVAQIVNDARNFFRNTKSTFDVIVFGLLDSHTQSSQMSSIRLDSYVYTLESFKEARARLNPHGIVCLSFTAFTPELQKKIFVMMSKAFDGHDPIALETGYDGDVNFIQNKEGDLKISPA